MSIEDTFEVVSYLADLQVLNVFNSNSGWDSMCISFRNVDVLKEFRYSFIIIIVIMTDLCFPILLISLIAFKLPKFYNIFGLFFNSLLYYCIN